MKASAKVRTVLAAGGIVVRNTVPPLIAIVRLRKDRSWVLPKGKLKLGEDVLAAALREVLEETGHEVTAHEFLGSMSHSLSGGRLKVVQFWRMRTTSAPPRALMDDVKAVKWLPLEQALTMLTHAHEQAFLEQVGPAALQAAAQSAPVEIDVQPARTTLVDAIRGWFRRVTQA